MYHHAQRTVSASCLSLQVRHSAGFDIVQSGTILESGDCSRSAEDMEQMNRGCHIRAVQGDWGHPCFRLRDLFIVLSIASNQWNAL